MAKGYWVPHLDVRDAEGYKAYMADQGGPTAAGFSHGDLSAKRARRRRREARELERLRG
ncbi:MAG TPA: hypothetical protein VH678_16930 [Xanthobacteraceae bacterium]|jgi:hypothetical protein